MRHQLTLVFLVASCQTGSIKIATRTTWWKKIEGWLDKNDDGCHLTYGSLRLQAGDRVILSAKPYGTKTSAFLC